MNKKSLLSIAIVTSVSLVLPASKVLAQLTPQQCANDVNQVMNALTRGRISQQEFVRIANRHHRNHPECGRYVSGSRITPQQLEMQRRRDRQHLQHMKQIGDQQVENYRQFVEMMR